MAIEKNDRVIARHKQAYHNYFVHETYEAGIELFGTEIKSLRLGQVNLKDSYCYVENGEIFARGVHISPYEKGNIFNRDPMRVRKLLMHKKEIIKLKSLTQAEGFTLVPLSLYFSGKNVKMQVGLCKGKKLYDKRETEAKKQADRDIERSARSDKLRF